ncbi:DEAD/DEAH box helicase [Frankia sp. AgB32]|uniref:DEAD/DEAH box helicase n=1 Tax=Frankia sp. AgB32 TaxID=631119 RepID=UPI0020107466|nr:AAA domain-containing protein [Frankia sp. AgB32]MCK9897301.1 AAA domain-containing protein [Frankia sp. AgB32]
MTTRPVTLRWPLAVVPSRRVIDLLDGEPDRLIGELTELSAQGALPARLEPKRDDPNQLRLVVYASRHVASLYVTNRSDGYTLGHVAPRTFRDEDRLTTAALVLHCPSGWRAFADLRDLPRGRSTFDQPWSAQWPELTRAWAELSAAITAGTPDAAGLPGAPAPGSALPPAHRRYLDLVGQVIDASRDIEVARQELAPPLPYARREATREQRYSGRGVYAFHLARPGGVTAGSLVQLADRPEIRGRVVRVDGRELIVRFEQTVDFGQIPPQGALRVLPSDRVYRIQRSAVEMLAAGQAANPALLANLVDGVFRPAEPDPVAEPRASLDDEQRDAFRRALTVPDLLCVLGPPGTGKTRTIAQIVLACVARGQRVLITSHTNRAVDNVLETLSSEVHAVRVGSESSMTAAARELTVDSQVEAVRRDILRDTALLDRLTAFDQHRPVLVRWLEYLGTRRAAARDADAAARVAEQALDAAVGTLHPQLVADRQRGDAQAQRWQARTSQLDESRAGLHASVSAREAAADAASGLVGWWRRWRLDRLRARLERTAAERAAAAAELTRSVAALHALAAQIATVTDADPRLQPLAADRDRSAGELAGCHRDMAEAAAILLGALRPLLAVPSAPPSPDDEAGWDGFTAWAQEACDTVRARGALLAEWRARIGDAETELGHELVRYAEVVAATCVGTASSPLLTDLVFDVAIIDEAGQISTPNMLVPMVRARRSVLVGDHHQLPPFLDEDVKRWSAQLARDGEVSAADAREIGELLTTSGFERLFPRVGPDRRVELIRQRRMPAELATFVSTAFYAGRLRTQHDGGGGDPVFRSPFAMIDTSDRPPAARAERALAGTEPWQQRGFDNELEAELIAAVVARSATAFEDWAVIVPYKAQAARIEAALARELGDPGQVAENVGTVDSFQGGERDLIVYGFTRSNQTGSVGFLTELRRLNVAITRAKRQLVLVGDTATLCSSSDAAFTAMARGLVTYLRAHGDLRGSVEIGRLLGERG